MKLQKILDSDGLQGYQIISPSKEFKRKYPCKFICLFFSNETNTYKLLTFNIFPAFFSYKSFIGYIFTYESKLPIFMINSIKYFNYASVCPCGLDQYFIIDNPSENENINLILSISPKNKEVPVSFLNTLILRCNSDELCRNDAKINKPTMSGGSLIYTNQMQSDNKIQSSEKIVAAKKTSFTEKSSEKKSEKIEDNQNKLENQKTSEKESDSLNYASQERIQGTKNIYENIMQIVKSICKDEELYKNTEDWLENLIKIIPINDNGLPNRYPNTITDDMFTIVYKNKNILDKTNIHINYDLRAKSYEQENLFITMIEDAFENMNRKVFIYNSFRNILPKIISQLDSKQLKYKVINENCIETTIKNIRNLDITYEISDFI